MNRFIFILFSPLVLIFLFALPINASASNPIPTYTLNVPLGTATSIAGGPAEYLTVLYRFSLILGTALAMLMVVVGAVRYTISAGNASRQSDAKDQITNAVAGLVLLLSAYFILHILNPNLVVLRNPEFQPVPSPIILSPPSGGTIALTFLPNTCSLQWTANVAGYDSFWILASGGPSVPPTPTNYWRSVPISQRSVNLRDVSRGAGFRNPFQLGRVYFRVVAVRGNNEAQSTPSNVETTLNRGIPPPTVPAVSTVDHWGNSLRFRAPVGAFNPCNVLRTTLFGAPSITSPENQWEYLAEGEAHPEDPTSITFFVSPSYIFNTQGQQRLRAFRLVATTNENRDARGPNTEVFIGP